MRLIATIAFAGAWVLTPAAAQACTYPQNIIKNSPQAAEEGFIVVRLRIANGLSLRGKVVALEGVVLEDSGALRAGYLVRFIVPDGWMESGACFVTPNGDTLSEDGQGIGYLELRESEVPGFYAVRFRVSQNEARLRQLPDGSAWQAVRFGPIL